MTDKQLSEIVKTGVGYALTSYPLSQINGMVSMQNKSSNNIMTIRKGKWRKIKSDNPATQPVHQQQQPPPYAEDWIPAYE